LFVRRFCRAARIGTRPTRRAYGRQDAGGHCRAADDRTLYGEVGAARRSAPHPTDCVLELAAVGHGVGLKSRSLPPRAGRPRDRAIASARGRFLNLRPAPPLLAQPACGCAEFAPSSSPFPTLIHGCFQFKALKVEQV
jgi:hypothetical protein